MSEEEKIIKIQEEIKGYKEKLYQDKNFVAELEENLTEDTWDYINKFNRYIIENKGGYINYEDDEYNEEEYYNNYVDIEALKLKFLPSKEWIEKNLKSYYSYCVKIIGDFGADVDEIDTKAIEKAGIEKCFKLWKLCICKNKHGWKISDEVAKEHLDECLLISKAMLNFEEIPSIFVEKLFKNSAIRDLILVKNLVSDDEADKKGYGKETRTLSKLKWSESLITKLKKFASGSCYTYEFEGIQYDQTKLYADIGGRFRTIDLHNIERLSVIEAIPDEYLLADGTVKKQELLEYFKNLAQEYINTMCLGD